MNAQAEVVDLIDSLQKNPVIYLSVKGSLERGRSRQAQDMTPTP